MKYFTKEWALKRTDLHLLLKPSHRAAVFSEEYFQELYALHVQERLEMMKRVSEVDVEALAERFRSPDAAPVRLDGEPLTQQERQEFGDIHVAFAEALLEAPRIQFDPEKERQFAHNHYLFDLRRLERDLPDEIKARVADMRVLALGYATPEVIQAIREYCEANERAVNAAYDAYREEFNRNFGAGRPAFLQDFHWHDDKVLSVHREDGDICLDFDWGCTCRFMEAEFIQCDDPLENAYWEYDEIYPLEGGGYEIHALLYRAPDAQWQEGTRVDFIIRCRDVKICCEN